ncbi:MAG: hypothetical protein KFF73_18275 [Cyclobacteriaceae bacterium]|nr:hypothetical protein [Cyclobacteriaceae bacterium]
MKDKPTKKIFDLVSKGPSGRLKALEFCFKNSQMNEKLNDQVKLLFRMLEDDLRQLEHYVLMDMESTREFDFYKSNK